MSDTTNSALFQFDGGAKQPNAAAQAALDAAGVPTEQRIKADDMQLLVAFANALLSRLGLQWVLDTVAVTGVLDKSVIPLADAEQQIALAAFINTTVADLRQQVAQLQSAVSALSGQPNTTPATRTSAYATASYATFSYA
jgi:hypothetical protein